MNVQNEVNICCKKLQMELKGLGIPKAQYEAGITRLMNWSRTLYSSVDGWVSREKCSEAMIAKTIHGLMLFIEGAFFWKIRPLPLE